MGFDIYPPPVVSSRHHFTRMNWLAVADIPTGAVVGLNPPYGSRGCFASMFISHALRFHPRVLALIVPDCTPAVLELASESNAWNVRVQRWYEHTVLPARRERTAAATAGGGTSPVPVDPLDGADLVDALVSDLSKQVLAPPYIIAQWDTQLAGSSTPSFYQPGTTARSGPGHLAEGRMVRPDDVPVWIVAVRTASMHVPFRRAIFVRNRHVRDYRRPRP